MKPNQCVIGWTVIGLLFMTGLMPEIPSTLPWYKFTSFSHARNYGTGNSVPKFVFGKYFEDNSATKLPFSIEVHHALMDGIHVSHFLERFQAICSDPQKSLG